MTEQGILPTDENKTKNSFYNKNYLKSIFLTRGFLSLLYVPIHFLSTAKKTKLISSTLSKSQ